MPVFSIAPMTAAGRSQGPGSSGRSTIKAEQRSTAARRRALACWALPQRHAARIRLTITFKVRLRVRLRPSRRWPRWRRPAEAATVARSCSTELAHAAFNTIKDITIREYSGSGDINDPASWTTSTFPGTGASLAGGDHGVWLTYHPIGILRHAVVVKLVDGHRSGSQMGIFPQILDSQDDQLAEDANGGLVAAYESKTGNEQNFIRLFIRTSRDGRHWSAPQQIYRVGKRDGVAGLERALAPDGGGPRCSCTARFTMATSSGPSASAVRSWPSRSERPDPQWPAGPRHTD